MSNEASCGAERLQGPAASWPTSPHPHRHGGMLGIGGRSFSSNISTRARFGLPPLRKCFVPSRRFLSKLSNAVLNFSLQSRRLRLPQRGTSGSVQRGPANPARPGREQRYRVSQVCRGDSEVPRIELDIFLTSSRFLRRPTRKLELEISHSPNKASALQSVLTFS